MKVQAAHHIERQVILLAAPDQAVAQTAQARIAALWGEPAWLAQLDDLFSELAPAGTHLYAEAIHLDLGGLDMAQLEGQFTARLTEALRQQLTEAAAQARFYGEAKPSPSQLAGSAVQYKSPSQLLWEAFAHFLVNGQLPFYTDWGNFATFTDDFVQQALQFNADEKLAMRALLLKNPIACLRYARYLGEARVWASLAALAPDVAVVSLATRCWAQMVTLVMNKPQLRDEWLVFLIERALANQNPTLEALEIFLAENLLSLPPNFTPTGWATIRFQSHNVGQPHSEDEISPALLTERLAEAAEILGNLSTTEEVHYLPNAGLVVLHPFFAACFTTCGWLAEDHFKDDLSREKAIRLLHFLATGEPAAAEYALTLPKVLCGAPLYWPLESEIVLTANELAEGVALLEAAIGHWSALKNTSPEGLREGFLQREGRLAREMGGWVLTVEQKAQDVLLGRLPYGWGLGLIRLPWLAENLRIEWVYG